MGCAPHDPTRRRPYGRRHDHDHHSEPTVDEQAVEEFAGRLFELFTGGGADLPDRHRPPHRPVRRRRRAGRRPAPSSPPGPGWRSATSGSGWARWPPAASSSTSRRPATYWLPREHAACLTGAGVENLAPLAFFTTVLAKHVPAVSRRLPRRRRRALRPPTCPSCTTSWTPCGARSTTTCSSTEILPLAPGLAAAAGRRGAGWPTSPAAPATASSCWPPAFPASTFVGYDLDGDALARGRAERRRRGLTNVTFEQCDAAKLTVDRALRRGVRVQRHPRPGRPRRGPRSASTTPSSPAASS